MSVKTKANDFVSTIANKGKEITSSFKRTIGEISQDFQTEVNNLVGESLVGINVNEVPHMQEAIKTYVNNIQDALNAVNTNTDETAKSAFANEEMRATLSTFVAAVMEACQAYTSQLLKFHTMLGNVKSQYEQQQKDINDTLTNASDTTRTSVEAYTIDESATQ